MRRSFALSVLVVVALLLLSGAAIAQEVTQETVATDVVVTQAPQDTAWPLYGWIVGIAGGLVTFWAAFKKFLKRNRLDVDDPRVIAVLRIAGQVALIGVAFLVLKLAKKLRGEVQDEVPNAKLVGSVLSEAITLAKWMCAAVVTEKVAPNMDPKSLASSMGAQPETIQMLVDSATPGQARFDSNARSGQGKAPLDRFKQRQRNNQNSREVPQQRFPRVGTESNQSDRGYGRSHG